ncbi:MAG: hypothetical protein FWE07_09085 [Turicibacter sp.]|nr:hypothetical protein [Turicibacter sp.]
MFNLEKIGPTIMKIIGGLVILLTFILFFMSTSDRYATHWMGLLFLVAAEVMFFFGVPFITQSKPQHNGTLLSSGAATILALYMGVALILALLSGLFTGALTFYMVLQLTFFFVAIILTLLLYAFSHKVNKDIEKTLVEREEKGWEAKRGKF